MSIFNKLFRSNKSEKNIKEKTENEYKYQLNPPIEIKDIEVYLKDIPKYQTELQKISRLEFGLFGATLDAFFDGHDRKNKVKYVSIGINFLIQKKLNGELECKDWVKEGFGWHFMGMFAKNDSNEIWTNLVKHINNELKLK